MRLSPSPGPDVFRLSARRQSAVREQPRRETPDQTAPLPAPATRQRGTKASCSVCDKKNTVIQITEQMFQLHNKYLIRQQ